MLHEAAAPARRIIGDFRPAMTKDEYLPSPAACSRRNAGSRRRRNLLRRSLLVIAAVLILSTAAARAQVDCDRYPAASAARNDCYQQEAWRAHDDLQNAYEERQHQAIGEQERMERQQRELERQWNALDPQDRDDDDDR
jgi:hypothetical protein